jgi:hypothetical protein
MHHVQCVHVVRVVGSAGDIGSHAALDNTLSVAGPVEHV